MEKGRSSKIIAIVALCVGVVGLSLGFAAFSSTLTISSSAEVAPDASTFNVDFSSSQSSVVTDNIIPEITPSGVANFTATEATISNEGDPTISNLKATFTEPGQKAVYSFYAFNAGEYEAFLNSITFAGSTPVTCTAKENTDPTLVANACKGIKLTVDVNGVTAYVTGPVDPADENAGSKATIQSHSLASKAGESVTVTIEYLPGSARADGDFDVAFGNVTLTYSSVD